MRISKCMQSTLTLSDRNATGSAATASSVTTRLRSIGDQIECPTDGTVFFWVETIERRYYNRTNNMLLTGRFWCTYIKRKAMLWGVGRSEVPARMARVRCSPDGMLSSTGRPRRVTSSRSSCWLRFRSRNSLKNGWRILLVRCRVSSKIF